MKFDCTTDFHIHSNNSGDAKDSIAAMCLQAVEVGIKEITFTEHLDFEPSDLCYGLFDYTRYMDELTAAREEFDGRLVIYAGIECDYQERYRSQVEAFLSDKKFDFVLGAAHYVDGQILENHESYFPGKNEQEAYLPYFKVVKAAVNSGLFEAIAHLDICKRYGCRYYGALRTAAYQEMLEELLADIISNGLTLEINTSGLRQSPCETYPSAEVVSMYAKLGGKHATIGSDAHRIEDLGAGLAEGVKIALDAGLVWNAKFDKRDFLPIMQANRHAEDQNVAAHGS